MTINYRYIDADIAGKWIEKRHIYVPMGVRGADSRLFREKFGFALSQSLQKGVEITYGSTDGQMQHNVG